MESPPKSPPRSPQSNSPPNSPHQVKFKDNKGKEKTGEEPLNLLALLQETRIMQLLPSREIITVDENVKVDNVLNIMAEKNIISIPVYKEGGKKFLGMFDVQDLVAVSLAMIDKEKEQKEKVDKGHSEFYNLTAGKVINFSKSDVLFPMDGSLSLYHLIEEFTRGIHRIPVTDENSAIINIVSQSSVVKFVASHSAHIGHRTLDSLSLSHKKLYLLKSSQAAIEGYKILNEKQVEAIPIVDDDGKIVGNLSASDLRGLSHDLFTKIHLPVMEFISKQKEVAICKANWTLKSVVEKMAETSVHRLWIVDDKNKPVGVVSLTDCMKGFLLALNPTPTDKRRSMELYRKKLNS